MNALRTIRGSYHEMATQTVGSPEREKKKKRTLLRKALTCRLACSHNKWLSKYKRRASLAAYRPLPLAGGREAGTWQPEPEGKGLLQSQPQRPASSTKLWAGSQLRTTSSWDPGGWHLPGGSQPEISSPEEIQSTPQTMLSWCTQETKRPRPGRW